MNTKITNRRILCMDMDAFFVSVEQSLEPSLKGKPCAVIGSLERTVIVTSSYEARKLGVKTGMNKNQATDVCPQLIFIIARPKIYAEISKQISTYLQNITPDVAVYSIDEAFMDITGVDITPEAAATKIKTYVQDTFDITCSVGAGSNMLIAKQATHINKPNGFYNAIGEDPALFMDKFTLRQIWGIGKSSVEKLKAIGLFTPKDVRACGEERLINFFGQSGQNIFNLVSGISEAYLKIDNDQMKSIGHSMTLPENIIDNNAADDYLLQLSEMVSSRARRANYSGDTVTLTVRTKDMSTYSFQSNIGYRTSSTHHIYDTIRYLYEKNIENGVEVRLLGVTLSGLDKFKVEMITVEDILSGNNIKKPKIYDAMDKVNAKFGERTLTYGRILKCKRQGSRIISPSWRPDGERNIIMEDTDDNDKK